MGEPSWKQGERRFARRLGTERQPLSGIRGGRTHSDSQHPTVYVEHKQSVKPPAAVTLLDDVRRKARREGKMPLIAYHLKGTQQVAVVLDSRDFFALWDLLREVGTLTMTDPQAIMGLRQRARAIVGFSARK